MAVAEGAKPIHVKPESAVFARSLGPFLAAVHELQDEEIRAQAFKLLGGRPPRLGAVNRAVERLTEVISENQMLADVQARREVLRAADTFRRAGLALPEPLAAVANVEGLPAVPFPQAVADVLARDARLATSAAEVAEAYGTTHAFAVAKATQLKVTSRVQKAVARAIDTGLETESIISSITKVAKEAGEEMADWSRSYAETVWRTNMSTAYSAGRFRQMADPAVAYAIGGLMFDGPTSPSTGTRPNHAAAVGLIGAADDPGWQVIAPPLGYNCRHSLSLISWGDCKRRGLVLADGSIRRMKIPSGAFPDKGFRAGGRPDQLIYGGKL
jgi:SPP1 gp7 family putative phage head morphogenesis protein